MRHSHEPVQLGAGVARRVGGVDPQVDAEVRSRYAVVHRQVGDAGIQQHVLAQQGVAGVLAGRLVEDRRRRSRSTPRACGRGSSPRHRRAGSAPRRWPPACAATACSTRCPRRATPRPSPSAHNDIPYLAIMYAVGFEPLRFQPHRRRQRQDVRVVPTHHVRNARLRHRIGAAHLDVVHQVEALQRHLGDRAAG